MFLANPITNTNVYKSVEASITSKDPFIAKTMRWIIEAQTFTYPVNSWIRNEVLQGITFRVETKTEETTKVGNNNKHFFRNWTKYILRDNCAIYFFKSTSQTLDNLYYLFSVFQLISISLLT